MINHIKFDKEKKYINEFINFKKLLYTSETNTESAKEIKQLLLNKHVLSKYFKLEKFLFFQNKKCVGRFCLTIYNNDSNLYLGFFECINDYKISEYMFNTAYKYAKKNKFQKIIGPVDASFWFKYRLKINYFNFIPYSCEPYNKSYYYDLFLNSNYKIIEHYTSNQFPIIKNNYYNGKFENRLNNFKVNGYKIISPNLKEINNILTDIYNMIMELYSDFPIFKKISLKDFKQIFGNLKLIAKPEMIKIAYYKNKAVGFYISIPNYYANIYNLNLKNILNILKLKQNPKEYVMLYMGVLKEHTGLGKALIGAIENELKENQLPSIGALARDGKVTQNYAKELIKRQYEYVLLGVDTNV